MQVLSAPLRASLFRFDFFFGKVTRRKSNLLALLRYKCPLLFCAGEHAGQGWHAHKAHRAQSRLGCEMMRPSEAKKWPIGFSSQWMEREKAKSTMQAQGEIMKTKPINSAANGGAG